VRAVARARVGPRPELRAGPYKGKVNGLGSVTLACGGNPCVLFHSRFGRPPPGEGSSVAWGGGDALPPTRCARARARGGCGRGNDGDNAPLGVGLRADEGPNNLVLVLHSTLPLLVIAQAYAR
jgi:hypothetical protein